MKLKSDLPHMQSISSYGNDWLCVGDKRVTYSVILSSGGLFFPWGCDSFESLNETYFVKLSNIMPLHTELVLFGSGDRVRFVPPKWLHQFYSWQIGVETMNTHAACRTYNVLLNEGRNVLAALVL